MAKIERFEDIRAWHAAREVVNAVYEISSKGLFAKDFSLRDQIRRAAISIPSTIAEGFSRQSNKEFIQFLFVVKGSAAEVQSQLYTALDQNYLSQDQFDKLYEKVEMVSRQLSKFITYLKEVG